MEFVYVLVQANLDMATFTIATYYDEKLALENYEAWAQANDAEFRPEKNFIRVGRSHNKNYTITLHKSRVTV